MGMPPVFDSAGIVRDPMLRQWIADKDEGTNFARLAWYRVCRTGEATASQGLAKTESWLLEKA